MSSGSSVTLRYRPQDDRGVLGPWVEGRFDLATGSGQALFSGDEAVLQGLFASGGTINFDAGAVVAVPEPTSALMLLGGLVALGAFRARQRRG